MREKISIIIEHDTVEGNYSGLLMMAKLKSSVTGVLEEYSDVFTNQTLSLDSSMHEDLIKLFEDEEMKQKKIIGAIRDYDVIYVNFNNF